MSISYAIASHNEGDYLWNLLTLIVGIESKLHRDYEIVVVDDFSSDVRTQYTLSEFSARGIIKLVQHSLNNDFAVHKNVLNRQCSKNYIMQLDADEILSEDFIYNLPAFVEANPDIEAYWLPRVNTVEGMTLRHVQQWGWVITSMPGFRTVRSISIDSPEYELLKAYDLIRAEENGYVTFDEPIIQWPDPQMRLYKNDPKIKWVGKVHEQLTGFDNFSMMPMEVDYAIRHKKEIARQEQQNAMYARITR